MSTKENKELTRQGLNAWNEVKGDTARIRPLYQRYYATEFVMHFPRRDMGWEQAVQVDTELLSVFPDFTIHVDDIVAEGDKVVTRGKWQGALNGSFMGISATKKHVVVKEVNVFKIEAGKIVEMWNFGDSLGLMTQLGVIPAPKK